jgi:hypothetical protein
MSRTKRGSASRQVADLLKASPTAKPTFNVIDRFPSPEAFLITVGGPSLLGAFFVIGGSPWGLLGFLASAAILGYPALGRARLRARGALVSAQSHSALETLLDLAKRVEALEDVPGRSELLGAVLVASSGAHELGRAHRLALDPDPAELKRQERALREVVADLTAAVDDLEAAQLALSESARVRADLSAQATLLEDLAATASAARQASADTRTTQAQALTEVRSTHASTRQRGLA